MSNAADIQKQVARLPRNQKQLDFERVLSAKEEPGRKLIQDPIGFARELAIDRNGGPLEETFVTPVKPVQQTLDIWLEVLKTIAGRESKEQMLDALGQFNDFLTYFWLEGVEKGLALGAVTEQYRAGLVEVLSSNDRNFNYGDSVYLSDITDICKKYGITPDDGEADAESQLTAAD